MNTQTKEKKMTKVESLDAMVRAFAEAGALRSWNDLVEEVGVPADLYPALVTSRPELIKLATPRAMSAEEVAVLYKLIGALVQTNMALKRHASEVAVLADNWAATFKHLDGVGRQIQHFANFREIESVLDENEAG